MLPGTTHTREMRDALSEKMRALMSKPEMRRKVSERTKEGMAKSPGFDPELKALRASWQRAAPTVRQRFLVEVLAPAWEKSPNGQSTSVERPQDGG